MNRSTLAGNLAGFARFLMVLSGFGSATHGGEVKLDGRTFTIPDGFSIERIAGSPLVDRPITAAFDDLGRLYVADSSGSNDNVKKQLAEKPHRIVRLEDRDGDGEFDKQTVFADKMMFPEGTMWYGDSLYVAAPPSIWKLTDTNGDGVADERVEWFQGKTLTGCANDLHGPYRGPDGWIYWCKGAFAPQTYERPGKSPFATRASHIFRCRPDGTGIEPVMTGGMDNPVDVAFTPGGERIFTTTFFVHPGGGQRDGLIHAIYGGIYGKIHEPIFEPAHKWTSPQCHAGPPAHGTGRSVRLDALRVGCLRHGVSKQSVCLLFQPAQGEPPRIGAPRHQLHDQRRRFRLQSRSRLPPYRRDRGRRWQPRDRRYRRLVQALLPDVTASKARCAGCDLSRQASGAPRIEDPRGVDLPVRALDLKNAVAQKRVVELLGDPRPAVQRRAIDALTKARANEAILEPIRAVGRGNPSSLLRRNCVWTLARFDSSPARALVREFLSDSDETVCQVALNVSSLARDREAVPRLVELLASSSLPNRRAAAEALGRIGDKSAVPALLEAAGKSEDRILDHSFTYALIEIGDHQTTAAGLTSKNNRTKKAALVALDQMDGGGLDPKFVAGLLAGSEPDIKETASWIIGRHLDWAGELAGVLGERLWRIDLPPAERTELERQLGRFAQAAPIQRLLAVRLRDAFAGSAARRSSLQAMAWSNLKAETVPREWVDAVAGVLEGDPATPELVAPAVATLRALPLTKEKAGDLPDRLLRIAGDTKNGVDLRLQALAAVPGGVVNPDQTLVDFLVSQLDRDRPVAARTTAADVLARAKLTAAQLVRLADLLPTAGPLEVDRLLAAFEQSTDEALGLKLVENLSKASALSSLRIDSVKASLAKYGPSVRKEAQALYTRLNVDLAKQKEKLEQLMTMLSAGDVRRGQLVFHSEKAACYSCHAIGYRGGNVGPDLTKIGSVRADRDLLEAIVFPSASFVRSFEPIAVATNDGKVFNGLLRGETADELILATGVNQETRVTRRDIEELRPSTVSVMPAGLEQQLTPQELADLVAFLRACK